MNFTRWSARLPGIPGTQRRAAARTDLTAGALDRRADGSVPAARAERLTDGTAPVPAVDELPAREVLDRVPALVALVHGPDHRVAYVNDAYTAAFGPRPPGEPAREALPELRELGLLPLLDQVLRSRRPRTLKSRKATDGRWYTFTCTPAGDTDRGPRGTAATDTRGAAATAPHGAIASPSGVTASPSGSASDPSGTGSDSLGSASDPSGTNSAPSGTANDPRGTANDPRGTANDPRGTANDPRGTNSDPRGTAADASGTRVDRRGTGPGVLVFATDVTDHAEAAERLRASERRQRETAVTLQRSLLPQVLEQPDDLRIAATYQPGGTEAAVGGDWYDVITLGGGRTALVIGDVMGRGVRAAAIMGQLRTAVRAYARLDLPPHEVLQLLDGLAAEIDANQIATCVYAVHDPNEGRLVYASAGHLPILVRDDSGTVLRADEPTGPPLGTGGWMHASGSVPLGPGSTAVLYTDGLVERRDEDLDEGIASLERALAGATGTPQVVCDRLVRSAGVQADHYDDVAVLVLQHPARTGPDGERFRNAALELLGGVEAAPRARAFASGVLTSWRFPADLHDLGVLAASELVANSLQHGTPPMRLRLRRTDRRLIVEVTDGDDHLPRRRRAEPGDESGRGIAIVATIASNWGSRRTPGGGKAVWCEFTLPPGAQPRTGHA
ncbi:SpoIIE family protein phosphatase [Streptomyces anandii]|uniref:SpoIIE family protein phosphatase n=1 Tax=Streptomyces anandii TaxID=285454 RepID=UPI003701B6CC